VRKAENLKVPLAEQFRRDKEELKSPEPPPQMKAEVTADGPHMYRVEIPSLGSTVPAAKGLFLAPVAILICFGFFLTMLAVVTDFPPLMLLCPGSFLPLFFLFVMFFVVALLQTRLQLRIDPQQLVIERTMLSRRTENVFSMQALEEVRTDGRSVLIRAGEKSDRIGAFVLSRGEQEYLCDLIKAVVATGSSPGGNKGGRVTNPTYLLELLKLRF
jgi:hypothetical protein